MQGTRTCSHGCNGRQGSGGRRELLEELKGVPNDGLELEIKFQGGAVFDPAEWSATSV